MREILFRGKRIDNGEWVYGYFSQHKTRKNFIKEKDKSCLYSFEVDPNTVSQYTGLTDKNGKKIFEGDIVNHYYSINRKFFSVGQVVFEDERCRFINRCFANAGEWEMQRGCIYEVIGNIHDNPELLEDKT